jgi:hypothetical protein
MIKCAVCGNDDATWAWQPWGPDVDVKRAFVLLGSHYRGFPTVKVCELCKQEIQDGKPVLVTVKGRIYRVPEEIL